MPSPFKIREALRLKPRLDKSQQSNVVSPGLARTPPPVLPGTVIRFDKPHLYPFGFLSTSHMT